jgi:GntR family transcriptional regulator
MTRIKPLAINVVAGDTRSISRQLVDAIRLRIDAGELAVGDKLPSVRGMAQQLRVNPNTISKAYAQLTSEGWLTASPGLGLFVASATKHLHREEQERRIGMAVDQFVAEVVALRYPPDDALERVGEALGRLGERRSA